MDSNMSIEGPAAIILGTLGMVWALDAFGGEPKIMDTAATGFTTMLAGLGLLFGWNGNQRAAALERRLNAIEGDS